MAEQRVQVTRYQQHFSVSCCSLSPISPSSLCTCLRLSLSLLHSRINVNDLRRFLTKINSRVLLNRYKTIFNVCFSPSPPFLHLYLPLQMSVFFVVAVVGMNCLVLSFETLLLSIFLPRTSHTVPVQYVLVLSLFLSPPPSPTSLMITTVLYPLVWPHP